MDFRYAPTQSVAEDAAAGLETAPMPPVPPAPVLSVGPSPTDGRSPLPATPGVDDSNEIALRGPLMEQRLLSTALDLMDHGPPKVRAAVWRDMMEVNGFLRRGPGDMPPQAPGSPTLNALIMGDRVANPLVEALGQLARALPVDS